MAFNFVKKATGNGNAAQSQAASKPKATPSFLKSGKAAQQHMAEAAEKAAQRGNNAFRFWLAKNESAHITFLDGAIDEDGMLMTEVYDEHLVKTNNPQKPYEEVVCIRTLEEQCPVCVAGKYGASAVGLFTIIDHREYQIQNGQNAGKVIPWSRKLYVPKMSTFQILNKQAVKHGGLIGCTFEVSRIGDGNPPRVGNVFDFVQKDTLDDIVANLGAEKDKVQPFNYKEVIHYRTADQIVSEGLAPPITGPGYSAPSGGGYQQNDIQNEL